MNISGIKNNLILNGRNNNIVTFSASNTPSGESATSASVVVDSNTFYLTPINDVFTFNFLQIFSVLSHHNILDQRTDSLAKENDSLIFNENVTYTIEFSDNTTEVFSDSYTFGRIADQIGKYKDKYKNKVHILGSTDLKVWKGYPFSISISTISSNKYTVNGEQYNSTGNAMDILISGNEYAFKNRFDFFEENTCADHTSSMFLFEGYNELEIGGNNLSIQYIDQCREGTYLKWQNKQGGYSYWLFEGIYKEDKSVSIMDSYQDDFQNINVANSAFGITGKTSKRVRKISSGILSESDINVLESVLDAPQVVMLNDINDNVEWQEVIVKDSSFNVVDTRRRRYKIEMSVEINEYSL